MKVIKSLLVILFCLFLLPFNVNAKENVEIHIFYSETCSFCKQEINFLDDIINKYDNITISKYEVTKNEENVKLFNQVRIAFDLEKSNVPLTVIGTNYYIGFNDSISYKIENAINYYSQRIHQNLVDDIKFGTFDPETDKVEINTIEENLIKLPFLGVIDPKSFSIPIIAIVIGLVDGFNPCAMWVLLFLISMLIGMKNKKRMWALGLTFIFTSAIIYLLFMVSWLKITLSITSILWVKILIGIVAILAGIINFRNYLKIRNEEVGCTVVDDKKRSKIIDKIKKIISEKSFILAIFGIITLAVSVNVVELACSAGLPLLFTQILAMNSLTSLEYIMYMLLYIFFFLLDDIIVFAIAMITLELTGFSNKYSKYSHLIGGIIMLIIGLLLIFKPELLSFHF